MVKKNKKNIKGKGLNPMLALPLGATALFGVLPLLMTAKGLKLF